VCVGKIKRDKSNLLNALVGQEAVPTGFVPVTAVPSVIRFDDEFHARIRMREGFWLDIEMNELKEYVTEELDSKNELILVINKAERTSDPERAATAKFTRAFLDRNPGCS
jgi:hypothetical protein